MYGIRRRPKTEHLSVKPDRHVNVVFAGKKHERVALDAELAALLYRIDLVNLTLDSCRRHRRIENKHIRSERRPRGRLCLRRERTKHPEQTQSDCLQRAGNLSSPHSSLSLLRYEWYSIAPHSFTVCT